MTDTVNISDLLAWSKPRRVNTKNGPMDVSEALPTREFYALWKSNKPVLKEAGVNFKAPDQFHSDWYVVWWRPPSEDEQRARAEALQASRARDAKIDVPVPDGLAYMPFQRAGIAYATQRQHTLIADEMGMGKSVQSIGVWNADPTIKKTLVICPATLRINWMREFKRWSTRQCRVAIIKGGGADAWPATPFDVLIINYDVLKAQKKRLVQVDWDLLIADESHYVKNPDAQRTRALLGFKPRKNSRTAPQEPIHAKRKLFLTGTPIENRPVELWPILESIDPNGLGANFFKFAKKFCGAYQDKWGWHFDKATNCEELQTYLREKFMVRRLKMDVLEDLPEKTQQIIELPANGATELIRRQQEVFDSHREYFESISEQERQIKLDAMFEEMSNIRHELGLAKVPQVISHLEDILEEGAGPVLVYAYHLDVQEAFMQHFGERACCLNGTVSLEERQRRIDDFQAGKYDVCFSNIREGYTMTRSSLVVFAEPDWNPSRINQFSDRTHRIGQKKPVLVQHLVYEDSLDVYMHDLIWTKQIVSDRVLDVETPAEQVDIQKVQTQVTVTVPTEQQRRQNELTDDQVKAVHEGLRMLAGVCDGARQHDEMGFNAYDSKFGKSLAYQESLSQKQAAIGRKMLVKYQRQLGDELVARIKGT